MRQEARKWSAKIELCAKLCHKCSKNDSIIPLHGKITHQKIQLVMVGSKTFHLQPLVALQWAYASSLWKCCFIESVELCCCGLSRSDGWVGRCRGERIFTNRKNWRGQLLAYSVLLGFIFNIYLNTGWQCRRVEVCFLCRVVKMKWL